MSQLIMQKRDPYDVNVQLENAGLLFLNQHAVDAAIVVFTYLVDRQHHHSNGWYGLANSLLRYSASQSDHLFVKLALQCVRRSLQENPSNRMSMELTELIRTRSGMTPDEYSGCAAYTGKSEAIRISIGFTSDTLVRSTQAIASWEERMRAVMWLGLQGIIDFAPLLLASAEHDPHPQVRMAAIKRLKAWAQLPEVRACFERLAKDKRSQVFVYRVPLR